MSPNNNVDVDVHNIPSRHDEPPRGNIIMISPDDDNAPPSFSHRPNIIRPIPRRVPLPLLSNNNKKNDEIKFRPIIADKKKSTRQKKSICSIIHPRLVHDFHRECQEAGVPQDAIEAAVEESKQWHRKWTLQEEKEEEEGHLGPSHPICTSFRRQDGTRNPPLSATSPSLDDDEVWGGGEEGHFGPMPHYVTFRHNDGSVNHPPLSSSSSSLEDDWGRGFFSSPLLRPLEQPALQVLSPLQLPDRVPSSSEDEEIGAATIVAAASSLSLPDQLHSVYSGLGLSHNNMTTTTDHVVDMESCKEALYHALAISQGDPSTREFERALLPLCNYYHESGWDARGIHKEEHGERRLEGMWLTLTKASYFGCLGENNAGDPMYTLGRMAFDMFLPTQLVCSLQGNFNPVHIVQPPLPKHHHHHDDDVLQLLPDEKIPKSLLEECKMGNHVLRTYNIVTAFTIEPNTCMADCPNSPNNQVRRPIKGIMTTFGYVLPDPQVPNRLSIWFTGGTLTPNNDEYDIREWKRIFDKPQPSRTFGEKARVLAANLLMGAQVPTTMEEDGTMEYTFSRPLGGHGVAYVDVIYLDNTLRIVRGHRGTLFVFTRIPDDGSFQ